MTAEGLLLQARECQVCGRREPSAVKISDLCIQCEDDLYEHLRSFGDDPGWRRSARWLDRNGRLDA